jgi:hypothetical protein
MLSELKYFSVMPRIVHLDTPGLLHYVMIQGIEQRKIFNVDKDRENFIGHLSILILGGCPRIENSIF